MNYRSTNFVLPIHTDYVMGVWTFMSIRFSQRLLLLDERRDVFLRTLVYLGGYCTIEQAQKLGLASSATRGLTQSWLKRGALPAVIVG